MNNVESASATPVSGQVKDHYEKYPYPLCYRRINGMQLGYFNPDPELKAKFAVVGCGTTEANLVANMFPKSEVFAIDLSRASISISKSINRHYKQNIMYRQGDFIDVLPSAGPFDVVIASGVLHHVGPLDDALQSIHNGLKDHGYLFGMVYNDAPRKFIPEVVETFRSQGLTPKEVKDALKNFPIKHPARLWADKHVDDPSEIADTWLHPYFRQYTPTSWTEVIQSRFKMEKLEEDGTKLLFCARKADAQANT